MDFQTFKEKITVICMERAHADPKFAGSSEDDFALLQEYYGDFLPNRLVDLLELPGTARNLLQVTIRAVESSLDRNSPMFRLQLLKEQIGEEEVEEETLALIEQAVRPMLTTFQTFAATGDVERSVAHHDEPDRSQFKTMLTTIIDQLEQKIAELEQDAGGPVTIADLLTSRQVTVMGL